MQPVRAKRRTMRVREVLRLLSGTARRPPLGGRSVLLRRLPRSLRLQGEGVGESTQFTVARAVPTWDEGPPTRLMTSADFYRPEKGERPARRRAPANAPILAPVRPCFRPDELVYGVTVKVVVAFRPDVRPIPVIVIIPESGPGPISGWGAPTKLPVPSVS